MADGGTEVVRQHARALAGLGEDIARMGFSYEVKKDTDPGYWEGRLAEHREYFGKSQEYYEQAHLLMRLVDPGQAGTFLLMLGKFHRLRKEQMEALERIRQNPTVMEPRDRQQSRWSKDAREAVIDCSNRCLGHEKAMSEAFRGFYDSRLRGALGDGGGSG